MSVLPVIGPGAAVQDEEEGENRDTEIRSFIFVRGDIVIGRRGSLLFPRLWRL